MAESPSSGVGTTASLYTQFVLCQTLRDNCCCPLLGRCLGSRVGAHFMPDGLSFKGHRSPRKNSPIPETDRVLGIRHTTLCRIRLATNGNEGQRACHHAGPPSTSTATSARASARIASDMTQSCFP